MRVPTLDSGVAVRLLNRLWQSPRAILAIKSGLAGALAWWAGSLLPTMLSDYAFYAPLAAFSVMLPAVSDSFSDAIRIESAILLGIGLATFAQWVASPSPVTIGLMLTAGIAIAAIPWFGTAHTWVPLAALYTLIFTTTGPYYAFGMAVQTVVGAVIGFATNFVVLPPLGHNAFSRNCNALARRLEARLRKLCETVGGGEHDDDDDNDDDDVDKNWAASIVELDDLRTQVRRGREHLERAARGNPRARRWLASRRDLVDFGQMLESLTLQVQQIEIVLREIRSGDDNPQLGAELRDNIAELLSTLADLLQEPSTDGTNQARVKSGELRDNIDQTAFGDTQTRYLAGMIAFWAGRCATTISGRIAESQQ